MNRMIRTNNKHFWGDVEVRKLILSNKGRIKQVLRAKRERSSSAAERFENSLLISSERPFRTGRLCYQS